MREKLIQYVGLLFAGVPDSEDIKQEILQNTLDRYDDLIAEGKVPEAAYRLAIAGIGDIHEILDAQPEVRAAPKTDAAPEEKNGKKKLLQAIAVGLYILCPVPVMILGNMDSDWMAIVGVCGLLAMVAVATVLMILGAEKEKEEKPEEVTPESKLRKSISSVIWAIGLAAYFALSFASGAWHITWLIFLITGGVQNLVGAILDLRKERASAVVRIILWGILLVILSNLLLGLASYQALSFTTVEEVVPVQRLENESTLNIPVDHIRNLKIGWVNGNILIESGDVENIVIKESDVSDPDQTLTYQQKNNTLSIGFQKNKNILVFPGGRELSKDLYIYVPRDWECEKLAVDAASATLEIRDMTIRELDMDGASGEVNMENCTVGDLDIDTASGDVTFSGSLDSLDFDAASANFTGDFTNIPMRLDMDGMSSSLDIGLPEDCGYTLSMDGLTESFGSEFEGTSGRDGVYVYGDGACRIHVDGLNYQVSIRKLAGK